jgi:hypothetical protein
MRERRMNLPPNAWLIVGAKSPRYGTIKAYCMRIIMQTEITVFVVGCWKGSYSTPALDIASA